MMRKKLFFLFVLIPFVQLFSQNNSEDFLLDEQYLGFVELNNTLNESSLYVEEGINSDDYNYYLSESKRSLKTKKTGMFLSVFGVAASAFGYFHLLDNGGGIRSEDGDAIIGSVAFIGGTLLANIGIPIWISGGVKYGNNKKAMAKIENKQAQLKLGHTDHGFALILKL